MSSNQDLTNALNEVDTATTALGEVVSAIRVGVDDKLEDIRNATTQEQRDVLISQAQALNARLVGVTEVATAIAHDVTDPVPVPVPEPPPVEEPPFEPPVEPPVEEPPAEG